MTNEEELAKVEAAIDRMLSGGAVEEFGEGAHRTRYVSYKQLTDRRDVLLSKIAAANNPMFYPVQEVRSDLHY